MESYSGTGNRKGRTNARLSFATRRGYIYLGGFMAENVWSYTVPDDGYVFPEHLVDLMWSYLQSAEVDRELYSLPSSRTQLTNLIYPAFQASLRTEEGRQVRLRIVLNPEPKRFTVQFASNLRYTTEELVKLAPTIGIEPRCLVVTADSAAPELLQIEGILDPYLLVPNLLYVVCATSHSEPVAGLKITLLGPGWVRVSTVLEQFDLHDCCMRQRQLLRKIACVQQWFDEVPELLGIQNVRTGAALVHRFMVNLLAQVSDARHGGTILVLPVTPVPAESQLKIKYKTDSGEIQAAVRKRSEAEPKVWAKYVGRADGPVEIVAGASTSFEAMLADRDLSQVVDCVAGLAAVDGAVILRRDLRLLGFGAEITAEPGGDGEADSWGMRHRSAARFCQMVPGSLAFVVSQDGGIRLFRWSDSDGNVEKWVHLSAEEW